MSQSREELVYLAKVSEQTQRFEDMLANMKKVAFLDTELSDEERNLLIIKIQLDQEELHGGFYLLLNKKKHLKEEFILPLLKILEKKLKEN